MLLVLAGAWTRAVAQDEPAKPAIFVTAMAAGDSIVLRWAPSKGTAWQMLNKYGYKIERFTILKDSTVLSTKPSVVVAPLVKPAAQAAWERVMDQDDYVAIVAQAIFGDDFELDKKTTDVMSMYLKSTETESRFSFAVFAADMSPRAAQLSGLRFVDRTIRKDEKYLYKIYSLVPEKVMSIATGMAYIGSRDYAPLPKPAAPVVTMKANQALVSWDGYSQQRLFTAYHLEKSVNNAPFKRVNRRPMINTTSLAKPHLIWLDTVPEGSSYRYRLIGITAFGQESPLSEVVDGRAKKKLAAQVAIHRANVIDQMSVALQWKVDTKTPDEIRGFVIERSQSANGTYSPVGEVSGSAVRTYTDKQPMATNYYRVGAKGDDETVFSFPYLVQLEDSIPPGAPSGLTAVADTAGLVAVAWSANREPDLLGYRIFRSNFRNSEFSQITISPLSGQQYQDTINLKTLSRSVFYKIAAVDRRFNTSEFSEVIEVKRPDVLPPMPPVISGVKSVKEGVEIQWKRSPSEDVALYKLYRRHSFSSGWNVVRTLQKNDTTVYVDPVGAQHQYEYYMIAIDEGGLQSAATKKFLGRALPVRVRPAIEQIEILPDRTAKRVKLTWQYNEASVAKYQVYRALPDAPLALYKTVREPGVYDDQVTNNTRYIYRVKAIFRDGSESEFSKEMQVDY